MSATLTQVETISKSLQVRQVLGNILHRVPAGRGSLDEEAVDRVQGVIPVHDP